MAFVLDASVAVAWLVGSQASPYSKRVRRLARRQSMHVPAVLWRLEVLNAVRQLERRTLISSKAADTCVGLLEQLVVTEHDDRRPFRDLFVLARESNLSVYDARYVALAKDLQLPLACGDGPLRMALPGTGLRLA